MIAEIYRFLGLRYKFAFGNYAHFMLFYFFLRCTFVVIRLKQEHGKAAGIYKDSLRNLFQPEWG